MQDTYNRNINYARISLTNKCNMQCTYCSPFDEGNNEENLSQKDFENLIDALGDLEFTKLRFTGGEPLLAKYLPELVKHASKKPTINDICITTNGILIDKYIDKLIENGLTRLNISLDTLEAEDFTSITKYNDLDKIIKNILMAKEKGILVKINCVLRKDSISSVKSLIEFGYNNNIEVRFIELMPIGSTADYSRNNYISGFDILKNIDAKIIESDKNDVTTYYLYKNTYTFGIISPMSNHFCNKCNRIRFTSDGKLRLCLHSDTDVDILPYIKNVNELKEFLQKTLYLKPEKHLLNEGITSKKSMVNIGG